MKIFIVFFILLFTTACNLSVIKKTIRDGDQSLSLAIGGQCSDIAQVYAYRKNEDTAYLLDGRIKSYFEVKKRVEGLENG